MLSSKDYRLKADEFANLMRSHFEESQLAWKSGDKAKAKEMSIKGNEYKELLFEINRKYNEVLKQEKELKRNTNFKEKVIQFVVNEKNKNDKIQDCYNFENKEIIIKEENFQDENILMQYDYNRNQAESYSKKMGESFEESRLSWGRGDKAKAKELSDLGYEYKAKMDLHNSLAVKLVALKNNENRDSDEIDLHGLYVNEAIEYFKETINLKINDSTFTSMRIVVGKGKHSKDKPKLKSAIANFANLNNLYVFEEPENEGCLIIFK